MRKAIFIVAALVTLPAGTASANTSHEGWPRIDGMLLMNKTDAPRHSTPGRATTPSREPTRATRATRSTSAARAIGAWCGRRPALS